MQVSVRQFKFLSWLRDNIIVSARWTCGGKIIPGADWGSLDTLRLSADRGSILVTRSTLSDLSGAIFFDPSQPGLLSLTEVGARIVSEAQPRC